MKEEQAKLTFLKAEQRNFHNKKYLRFHHHNHYKFAEQPRDTREDRSRYKQPTERENPQRLYSFYSKTLRPPPVHTAPSHNITQESVVNHQLVREDEKHNSVQLGNN
jgi:hypothetical protein